MRKTITTRFSIALLLLLSMCALRATAADTLVIARTHYHIDRVRHLILVNQRPEALTPGPAGSRYLALDSVYAFAQPLTRLRTDSAYRVQRGAASFLLYFTRLPVVHVDSRWPIVDSPSVYGQFSLTESSGQVLRANLGVEFRGGFSQTYPKKSLELTFWDDTTGAASRDVSLLGMRTDNKYNLQALYNEPLRFRSKVANELWQEVHQVYYQAAEPEAQNGIDMAYVEVFVNGEYRGVYALAERVDRKQLKLKKFSNGIVGELYKGSDWGGAVTFHTLPAYDNNFDTWGGFEYKHPDELVDWSNLYNFVDYVENTPAPVFYATYQQKFHLGNAVDYYLFLNLTRAADNTGKNLYIAKYKRNEPYFYVPWDLDGVFGTDYAGGNTGDVDDILSNGLYDRLNQDCAAGGFRETLNARWTALRATVLTEQRIMAKFRREYNYLTDNNVYAREQLAWSGYQHDTTQLAYTRAWLRNRLSYLDGVFGQTCSSVTSTKAPAAGLLVQLYPNPAQDYLQVQYPAGGSYELSIRDLNGRLVRQAALRGAQNRLDLGRLPKGVYVVTVRTASAVATQKLVVQ